MNRYARAGALRRSRSAAPRRWLTVFLAIAVLIAIVKTITLITGRTNPVDRAINATTTPLVVVLRYTVDGFASLGAIFHLPSLLRENRELAAQNALLQRQISEAGLTKNTDDELRASLHLSVPQFRTVNATVIARPYDLWLDQVILDTGSRDGVRAGDLVVNPAGVVGVVDTRVERGMCWVTLLTSPRFRLAAVTGVNQVEGVIRGLDNREMTLEGIRGRPASTDDGNLAMIHVKAGSLISVGEKVFTAEVVDPQQLDARRPRGQLIGTVTHRSIDLNGALDIRIEPAVNVNRLNVVTVLVQ